jgi:hypothetical protein
MKYKVVLRAIPEFGNKSHIFVIAKKSWLGFYFDTNEYYFDMSSAEKKCEELNNNNI